MPGKLFAVAALLLSTPSLARGDPALLWRIETGG